ncbi:Hydroxyacylglutathione hydrolase [Pseudovibrio axinellae]|uniref:Hydroxyacylglutathione hydrolase n=1 Tax=Pseudovibrio axinellae TaxID=989403 RepID=A0A165YID1_9HYPH|nr:MBL fold metallo-hydrolase [Pseudovibrio axinellae]KZL18868.1 Hydroxyacylglutathione hydrolase [Pseudovibrio axinellae]SEP89728.1 Glyoxylase, beta-lactamase superfamily II [Pseudovibrio axinellae]
MSNMDFNRSFDARHGELVSITDALARVTCNNPGALTFAGTNTFIVGRNELVIIDPGPMDMAHLDALMTAIDERPVKAILVSHTHVDHSPLAGPLREKTGAPVMGCGPHRRATSFADMAETPMDASSQKDFEPDTVLEDGAKISVDGVIIEVVATPGHTENHLSFALPEHGVMLPGDHVMAWSTTIVAPPDGSMNAYMTSLDKLIERAETRYFPSHGGEVKNPKLFLTQLKQHRQMRSDAIVARLRAGDQDVMTMVKAIYTDVDPKLHGAAALNVLAQLDDLIAQKIVLCDGEVTLTAKFTLHELT